MSQFPPGYEEVRRITEPLAMEFHQGLITYPQMIQKTGEALGLKLSYTQTICLEDPFNEGIHLFIWEIEMDKPITEAMNFFMTEDDDSQPHAIYTRYLDTIFHVVPFFA